MGELWNDDPRNQRGRSLVTQRAWRPISAGQSLPPVSPSATATMPHSPRAGCLQSKTPRLGRDTKMKTSQTRFPHFCSGLL